MFHVLGRTFRKLIFWTRRKRLSQELAEELRLHLYLKEAAGWKKGKAGGAPEESRRAMGNVTLAKEESRDM
jgi:hypothetical protein